MSDFSPETRNSAWWSGDSRLAAQGKANEAILIKQGKMERPDLSNIEAVQMGHVMEPVIGQLAQKALGVELTKIEDAYAHKTEPWLKSHFDFVGRGNDGQAFLVEAKNYNAGTRNKLVLDLCLLLTFLSLSTKLPFSGWTRFTWQSFSVVRSLYSFLRPSLRR